MGGFRILPLDLGGGRGKFIKSVGEGNIMAVGKNITWKKAEGESNIIFSKVLRLLGRISSMKKGKGTEIPGKKTKILKGGVGILYPGHMRLQLCTYQNIKLIIV